MSVTTGRKVTVYSSKSVETPCSYLCQEENFFYFHHEKSYATTKKQKLGVGTILVKFLENLPTSNCVRSTVV